MCCLAASSQDFDFFQLPWVPNMYLSYVKSTFARVYYFDLSQFDGFPGPCSSLVLHGLPGSSGPLEPHGPCEPHEPP